MRFVIARMNHETNTFSPLPTPLSSFAPQYGGDALIAAENSTTAMAAFVRFARERNAEIATPLYATANPSGRVSSSAFETMTREILDSVEEGCDAVLLDLHGAMVTEDIDDGEGELLARLRSAVPNTPIGVALDLHANVTSQMIDNSDVLIGFKTYPHVDMVETGDHVAQLVGRILDEGLQLGRALLHPPLLAQTLRMNTTVAGPMRDAIAAARKAEERPGVLAASIFGGFPIADIAEAGVSIVVVGEDTETVGEVAEELGDLLWADREGLIYHEEPLTRSVARAAAAGETGGPVLLLDHGDNCMSGGTCDRMDVLAEALRQGLKGIIAGPICDPAAVDTMADIGVGGSLTLGLGNCWSLPGIGGNKPPLELSGAVAAVGDGSYVIQGPTYNGMPCSMGRAAVLKTDQALILVSEEPHEPWDVGVFSSMGINPRDARFLILKSRMYCRPVFEPIAKAVIECASLGVTSSDYDLFTFERLARPVYPLDLEMRWTPGVHLR